MSLTHLVLDGPLAVLSLVRPGGNRISFAMRRALRAAVRQVAESGARALLVRGVGPDFCLGGDVGVAPPAQAAVKALDAIDICNGDDDDLDLQVDRLRSRGLDCSFAGFCCKNYR